jgi:hypothetical protein
LLHVAGAEVIGLLPGDLSVVTEFAVAIMVDSKKADVAAALIKMLNSRQSKTVFQIKGLVPT